MPIDNELISIFNIYLLNGIVPKYLKEKLIELQGEIDSKTISGNFHVSLSAPEKSKKMINKIKNKIKNLN